MGVDVFERLVGILGAMMALVTLGVVLLGLWRSLKRPKGRAIGLAQAILRGPVYLLISVLFFGTCFILWRPLPLTLSLMVRVLMLVLGISLYFPGLALVLWGRLTLGKMYNVSSALAAQLYIDHQLIIDGPFAYVRHPMYLGVLMAAFGGLLIYRTWTLVFLAVAFLGLVVRARREEQGLAAEFGEQWEEYCERVPAWIPCLLRGKE